MKVVTLCPELTPTIVARSSAARSRHSGRADTCRDDIKCEASVLRRMHAYYVKTSSET